LRVGKDLEGNDNVSMETFAYSERGEQELISVRAFVGNLAQMRYENLSNTIVECYLCVNLLGVAQFIILVYKRKRNLRGMRAIFLPQHLHFSGSWEQTTEKSQW
jgi:hypothetical protein